MAINRNDLPRWLISSLPPKPTPEQVATARAEFYSALGIFQSNARQVIAITLGAAGASITLLALGVRGFPPSGISAEVLAAAFMLATVTMISPKWAIPILDRYYEVYVSGLLYAAKMHVSLDDLNSHPWISRILDDAIKLKNATTENDFIKVRVKMPDHSRSNYEQVIRTAAKLTIGGAVIIIIVAIASRVVVWWMKSSV